MNQSEMCCRQIHVNLSDYATGNGCGGRLNETVFNPVPSQSCLKGYVRGSSSSLGSKKGLLAQGLENASLQFV
ncbi:hypothetical protein TWF970_008502 [Orbilia oligospora]|nr:hypothetical protein TWF970_008502 [Orbilia oligospora]